MTIGGQYVEQSGRSEMEKEQEEDQEEDGAMTNSDNGQHSSGQQRTGNNGENLQKGTSSSGGTHPRYKVQIYDR